MKNHRMLTFAGAGSALAASIMIATVVLVPTPASTVGAATIFASLREATGNAFQMTFEDVGVRGIRIDGELVVVFDDDAEPAPGALEPAAAVYFDAHARADEEAGPLAGLDVIERAAFTPDQMWVYVKVNELSDALLGGNPIAGMYAEQLESGMLIDITAFIEALEGQDWEGLAEDNPSTQIAATVLGARAAELPDGLTMIGISDNAEVNELFTKLLTGRTSPEDFDRFATLLEEAAGDVTVTPQRDGSYLLQAGEFNFADADLGSELDTLFGQMTLSISYDENAGMLGAAVEHLGPYDGVVRFERAEVSADDPMFSDQRYREDDQVTVLDMSAFLPLLGLPGQDGG